MAESLFDGLFENSAPDQTKEGNTPAPTSEVQKGLPENEERELTPLEQMKLAKEKKPAGLVIDNPEEKKMYKSPAEESLQTNGLESMNEMDSMINKVAFARQHN